MGFGLLFATLIAVCFIWAVPNLFGKYCWPYLLTLKSDYDLSFTWFFFLCIFIQHEIVMFFGCLFYYTCHHYEFTFIEQFKCNNNPWPWYENRKAWNKQLKSSILLTFFNTHILMPVVYYIFETSGLGDEH